MSTTRHDADRMTITEALALAQGAALGVAMVLDAPVLWHSTPGARVVIVYAFTVAIGLFATARAGARCALAIASAGMTAGLTIMTPYLLETGFSVIALEGLVALASELAMTGLGVARWARRPPVAPVAFIEAYPTPLESRISA